MFGKIKEALNSVFGKEVFTAEMTEAEVHDKLSDMDPIVSVDNSEKVASLEEAVRNLISENKSIREAQLTKESVKEMIAKETEASAKEVKGLQKEVAEIKAGKIITSTQTVSKGTNDIDEPVLDDLQAFNERMKKAEAKQAEMRKEFKKS